MARPATAAREVHRLQTEQWRAKLRKARRPEACHVDVALAAALSVVMDAEAEAKAVSPVTRAVFAAAVAFLEDRGYDKVECKQKIFDRIRKRKDLPRLRKVTGSTVPRGPANE
ncbi:hypothetical protein ACTJK5_09540 [Agrobacterium sp. 22094]|uniref:hypothetical protein n=1 Tax=Agrobacterium sp. 22094 TaxID=3453872 RepID=UPI003F83124D